MAAVRRTVNQSAIGMTSLFKAAMFLWCCSLGISAEQSVPAAEAAKHVGEKATVCWSRCQFLREQRAFLGGAGSATL
jgi:hypothetical protein